MQLRESPGEWERRSVLRKRVTASFDPKIFLAKVGDGKAISKYQKGQIAFSQGDRADAVFYIQKGKIKLTVVSERGKEAVVGLLGPGHFFGEGCLNGHPLRVTTATAIEDCLITRIAKTAMIATMHDEPKFSELFMADLLSRNSRIEEDLIERAAASSAAQEPDNDPGRNPTLCAIRMHSRSDRWGRRSPSLGSFATHRSVFGLSSVGGAEA